jgi:hypothetical protein
VQQIEATKGNLEFQAEGWALYATDNPDVQVLEWENECAARLAWALHEMLRRHALSTAGLGRLGDHAVYVKRLELIELMMEVDSTVNDTKLAFVGKMGTRFTDRKEAERVPGAKPTRLKTMEDAGLHAARALRAHLLPLGLTDLKLRFQFGVGPGGETLIQVPNPLDCDFGSTDLEAICAQL